MEEPVACSGSGWGWTRRFLLTASLVLYGVHFVHLTADFPHNSPWNDWSKYTDEGWYGDGAIRHIVLGHWYLPGDFNPAVAMPVWPLLEAAVFHFTGVSLLAARALAVEVFGVMLLTLYALLGGRSTTASLNHPRLAAPLAVFLASTNSFLFAFDRLAILEPLAAALGVIALWLASSLGPRTGRKAGRVRSRRFIGAILLGIVLALLGLSKPTAVALLPAILFLLWRSVNKPPRSTLQFVAAPVAMAAVLCIVYFSLVARFHLLADYWYLFEANAYTGFELEPLTEVARNTVWDSRFLGGPLVALFVASMVLIALVRRHFFRDSLVQSLLLWAGGYLLLLGYHNNLQPRYYLLLAVPVIALLALALEQALAIVMAIRSARGQQAALFGMVGVGACVAVIALPGIAQEIGYLMHPDYSYVAAARQIAAIVRADPKQSSWVLSVSGSDLTLMTGLPSIDDDFGTLDLDQRIRQYRPGWYVAWNEMDDDKMDALRELYQPVRVAAFPAMDDPDRNLLILYRLDPAGAGKRVRKRHSTPPALRTRSGQQPAIPQLRH